MFKYTNPNKSINEQSKFGPKSGPWKEATRGKPAADATPATPSAPLLPGSGGTPALTSKGSSGAIVPASSAPSATTPAPVADRSGMGGLGTTQFRRSMAIIAANIEKQKKELEEKEKADKAAAEAAAAAEAKNQPITITDIDKSGVGRTVQVPARTRPLADPRRGTRLVAADGTVVPFDDVLNAPIAQGRQITRTVAPVQQTQQPLATTQPAAVTTTDRPEQTIRQITRTVAPVQQTQTQTDQVPVVQKPTEVVTQQPTQQRQPRERAESLPPMSMYGRMGGGAGTRMQGTPGSQGVPPTPPTPPSVVVNPPSQQPPVESPTRSKRNIRIAGFLSQPVPQVQTGSTAETNDQPGPFAQALSQMSANISKVRAGETLSATDYENAFRKLAALKQPIADIAGRIKGKIKSFLGMGGRRQAPPGAVPPVYPRQAPPGAVPPKPPVHTLPGDNSGASYMDPFGMTHGRPSTGTPNRTPVRQVTQGTRRERINAFLGGSSSPK